MAENNGQDNGLYSYDSFGPQKKSGPKRNFLWWCAGTHEKLLREFPSEHAKYSGLGGVLLATFVLASISAGYAIMTVFNSLPIALFFAFIWGLIIFNFDRFLVSTMRKYGVSRRKQIWMAVPRLFLALLIGFTIARPLELKIFEKEVNVKMVQNLHKKIQLNDSLLTMENNALMNAAETERQRLTDRKILLEDQLSKLQSAYVQEADGTGGSLQRGIQDLTKMKKDAHDQAVQQYAPELAQLDQGIKMQDSILTNAKTNLEEKRKQYEQSATANMGFLERNKALSDLSGEESSVFWSNLLLSLLIIMIEIGPVLSKLIMPVGPYDVALAKEELTQMASDETKMRADKELLHEKKRVFYQKQKEMSDQLVDKVTEMQKKNIDIELDKWERGEWNPKDHRASMDEVMRKIKEQYQVGDEGIL